MKLPAARNCILLKSAGTSTAGRNGSKRATVFRGGREAEITKGGRARDQAGAVVNVSGRSVYRASKVLTKGSKKTRESRS